MNPNNRSRVPANVPRTLRPKAVSVSPIKSPLGNVVPQMVLPVMSPQGQNQYLPGGTVVPQVYHGATVSQTVPTVQPRMTAQALYPQTGAISQTLPTVQPRMTAQALYQQTGTISQTLPISQPRMAAIHAQSGVVTQNLTGGQVRIRPQALFQQTAAVSQTTPGSQPRISALPLYPQVGTLAQNLPASQTRMSAQVVYPSSAGVGTRMSVVQNSVSMVQNRIPMVQNTVPMVQNTVSMVQNTVPMVQNSVPMVQNSVPLVRNSVPILVSAAPVFQNMGFQQNRTIAISPQSRQQFSFQGQIRSNVQSPVHPASSNVINQFQQQNYGVSNQIRINPAYISSQNKDVINQMSFQTVASQNVSSRFGQMSQTQNVIQSQMLTAANLELKKDVVLEPVSENKHSARAKLDIPSNDSMENKKSELVMEQYGMVSGVEQSPEEQFIEIKERDDLHQVNTESENYTEMSLNDSLISDAQFGMRSVENKNYLEEQLIMPNEQNSPVVSDNQISDSLESPSVSNLVNTSDIEEIMLFPPTFEEENTQSSHTSMEFADSPVDSKNADELTNMEDDVPQQDGIPHWPYNSNQDEGERSDGVESYMQIEPRADSEDYAVGPSETHEGHITIDALTDQAAANITEDTEIDNISETLNLTETALTLEINDDSNSQYIPDAMEGDYEMKDSEDAHSSTITKTNVSIMAGLNSLPTSSCEDSQDMVISSDVYDTYTDDSNTSTSMTWEKFHRTVLNLRAKKNGDKTAVSYTALKENSQDSCDIESDKLSSIANSAEEAATKITEDGHHEQSFEGEDEEPEFVWEDFLQQTGTTAVPPTAFKHVEYSLQSGFVKGMKLEVPNKSDPSTYWVASVLMTCGPLLRLRYDGYADESSGDFWCDLATTEIHPIGWSAQNGKNLQPPDEIRDRVNDWRTFLLESLTGARTAPLSFFEKGAGCSPVDQLKCGMKLELQDALNPLHVWLVQILENVGGRLYLIMEGTQSASKHFWMFYLNPRLHPIGWANQHEGCVYRPPQDIYNEQTDESWAETLQAALKECENDIVPADVFKDQPELKPHQFTVGMKVEALNPGMNTIGPATVTKVINNLYFIVEMDDLRKEHEIIEICCNSEYLGIFPISWCQCKGIRLCPPRGWSSGDFVWGEYLSMCNAKAAPEKLFHSGTDDHDFERGMKLEAVNPNNPNQICAATITKIVGPLLWIHLDHVRDIPSHIEDIDSQNLFPVGWCESNNYLLKPPVKIKPRQKHISERKTEEVYRSITSSPTKEAWCPVIYFNHRCFSGPYLSKGRISDLPKHVGPGPMDLVLREVLSLLISIAYVPCRALKEIQQDGPFNPSMKAHILKAKYKGKKYKAIVEVCQNESQLEEFCRNTCIKLECCPYLFSPLHVRNGCPENCQQLTKTKLNPNYVKKRKPSNFISIKPRFSNDGSSEPKKRGRKKKKFLFIQKKGQRQYDANGDLMKDEGFIDDYDEYGMMSAERRRYDIQTRGAKLPKYSFEKKSHRKILMSQANVHTDKHKQGLKRLMHKAYPTEVKHERLLVPREGSMKLESNPLHWTVNEVVQFLKTTDCSHLARIIKEQEVDGQAFLLMNLSAIQEHLELKLGPAVKLCHQIERLKLAFYENYA